MFSTIAIGLSPNTQKDDVWRAVITLFTPWKWKTGSAVIKVEQWFENRYPNSTVFTVSSARTALFEVLQAFDISKGDEVILQVFTCVAVPDSIIWAGAKPVFVDINDTLNIDENLLQKYITEKTKAIIVQHTFGIPANLNSIKKIAQKHNLLLIEDCAHSLGAQYEGKKIGSWGDAAVFSFGRDKVISSVFGGLALISRRHKKEINKFKKIYDKLTFPGYLWIFQQLFHPIAVNFILPLYSIGVGKLILVILQKMRFLSKPVENVEKKGGKPSFVPAKYPNALAILLLGQLVKLDKYNNTRRLISQKYYECLKKRKMYILPKLMEDAIYLRFNILTEEADNLRKLAAKKGIYLGVWYRNLIDPEGVDFRLFGFTPEKYVKSNELAGKSLNLPTYPKMKDKDVEKVINFLYTYADQRSNK